jgi:hypothetical protein
MEVQQRVHARVDGEQDVASVPTVTAVGTAQWLEFLAQNRDAAVPAVTRLQVQHRPIHEARHVSILPPQSENTAKRAGDEVPGPLRTIFFIARSARC